ncbi:NAD-dependent epimerase/dehydratase family protein [Sinomonas terrae]|uniref:NAD-dependent epimerase/dehydratase family protein n=1 Tax=Sinomonas terrae TaxID=2908838 RepID=A0ABS9U5Y1_9MICC|nr:NAD-dependent epimerase/dehydratase family protein [Sinomonas terrae]MCH6471807.1 NAD-dependent epimerase/dehydratase family protein [Sinomonas terrae]
MSEITAEESRRRVVLTGGLGFIGTKLVECLIDSHDVLVVDNLHPQVHTDKRRMDELARSVNFVEGDVTNPANMRVVAEFCPHVVVHLAAETGTGQSLLQSRRHAEVNVTGTATLLDALAGADALPERLVIPSSRAIYGEGAWTLAGNETQVVHAIPRDPGRLAEGEWLPVGPNGEELSAPVPHCAARTEPRPANVYAATKLAQENVARAWAIGLGVPLSVLRLQNVYGAGQAINNPYTGVLTFMARQALAGEQINVFEGGGIIRDFVNVSDVAEALTGAVQDESDRNLTLDIGSGCPVSLDEVARLLSELSGAPEPRVSHDFRVGDVRAASADISAATDALGFLPAVGLRAGLHQLLSWVSSEALK